MINPDELTCVDFAELAEEIAKLPEVGETPAPNAQELLLARIKRMNLRYDRIMAVPPTIIGDPQPPTVAGVIEALTKARDYIATNGASHHGFKHGDKVCPVGAINLANGSCSPVGFYGPGYKLMRDPTKEAEVKQALEQFALTVSGTTKSVRIERWHDNRIFPGKTRRAVKAFNKTIDRLRKEQQ